MQTDISLYRKHRRGNKADEPPAANQRPVTVGPQGDVYAMVQPRSSNRDLTDILMEENVEYGEGDFTGGSRDAPQAPSPPLHENSDPKMPLLKSSGKGSSVHDGIYCFVPDGPDAMADSNMSNPTTNGSAAQVKGADLHDEADYAELEDP